MKKITWKERLEYVTGMGRQKKGEKDNKHRGVGIFTMHAAAVFSVHVPASSIFLRQSWDVNNSDERKYVGISITVNVQTGGMRIN